MWSPVLRPTVVVPPALTQGEPAGTPSSMADEADSGDSRPGFGRGTPQRARTGGPFRPGNPVGMTLATAAGLCGGSARETEASRRETSEVGSSVVESPVVLCQAYVRIGRTSGGTDMW